MAQENEEQELAITEQKDFGSGTVHNIKLGKTFQLQTKSFWISLVCILCIFLLTFCSISVYLSLKTMKMTMEHEEKILELLVKTSSHQED